MATYTVANLADVFGSTAWSFDGSSFLIGTAGVGIVIGGATGGDIANSVNLTGGYYINGTSIFASPQFTGTVNATVGYTIGGTSIFASPALTGTPTAPTASAGTNTTQLATTAFVQANSGGSANKLCNPFCDIDQANEGATVVLTSNTPTYIIDGCKADFVAAGAAVSAQRSTNAPTGFPNSLELIVTTGGTLAAGAFAVLQQPIEGADLIDTAFGTASAQPLAVSFWFTATIAGVYSGAIQNAAFTRSYPFNFTLASANVWQLFTVTIPGDTSGTWVTSGASAGMYLTICGSGGSTFQSTVNTWAGGNFFATSSNTNSLITTTGAQMFLGPRRLGIGTSSPPIARQSFESDLSFCQRYYEKSYNLGTALGTVTSVGCASFELQASSSVLEQFGMQFFFAVKKRATPTCATYSTVTGTVNKVADLTDASDRTPSYGAQGQSGFFAVASPAPNPTAFLSMQAHWTADARP